MYDEATVDGRWVLQCHALEAYPHNVSFIWFAPNHVRAFRQSIYETAGGYDATRDVLDDQDIMCRMYQITDFHLIDECLYLQRMHKTNTQREARSTHGSRRKRSSSTTATSNRTRWPGPSAAGSSRSTWAHQQPSRLATWALASNRGAGVDIVGDSAKVSTSPTRAWASSAPSTSCRAVSDKVALFNEFYRLLAHGGLLMILTPSTDGRGAFQDPTHVAYYNENSFWYFTDQNYAQFVPDMDAGSSRAGSSPTSRPNGTSSTRSLMCAPISSRSKTGRAREACS